MPDSLTYDSYNFPSPLPAIAESDELIVFEGKYDHKAINIQAIGTITGDSLSGIHLQKMQMISGFLNEYQNLTVTLGTDTRVFSKCLVEGVDFGKSDLSTVLPYSVSFKTFENETFSEYFKIESPVNEWSYSELDNKVIRATHNVSAIGLKVDAGDPLTNARSFVNAKLQDGFEYIGFFNSGVNGFLQSKEEKVDRKTDAYSVTEVYLYSASDQPLSSNGIVNVSTDIAYDKNSELSVSVKGNVQGGMDANISNSTMLTTGDFSPKMATNAAEDAIASSLSNYETGKYTFVSNGPTSYEYTLDTGSNNLEFSFTFENAENIDLITGTNVLHSHTASISCTKDSPVVSVNVEGELRFHGPSISIKNISQAGVENDRFKAVSGAFELVDQFSIAKKAADEFSQVATGYELNSSYLNVEPVDFSIDKNPNTNEISYNYTYNNVVDYSNGTLKDLSINIVDKVPIQKNDIQQTIGGFKANVVADRTLGEYSISASSNDEENKLSTLKNIVLGLCSGQHKISDSHNIQQSSISYNLSKYY